MWEGSPQTQSFCAYLNRVYPEVWFVINDIYIHVYPYTYADTYDVSASEWQSKMI
jgi:hypothetical protein